MTRSVWAITMVGDERDIIGYTLSHMLSQNLDGIMVADNLSEDGTREILNRLADLHPGKLIIVDDKDPAHYQSSKMTSLAQRVAVLGAEMIIPFDADELWYSTVAGKTVGEVLAETETRVVKVPVWNHYCTQNDAQDEINPYRRMIWMMPHPGKLWKVAFRYSPDLIIDNGNHQMIERGRALKADDVGLALRHLAWRSEQQWITKIRRGSRALSLTDLPRGTGQHWREYGDSLAANGEEASKAHFRKYFSFGVDPWDKMIIAPAPYTGEL